MIMGNRQSPVAAVRQAAPLFARGLLTEPDIIAPALDAAAKDARLDRRAWRARLVWTLRHAAKKSRTRRTLVLRAIRRSVHSLAEIRAERHAIEAEVNRLAEAAIEAKHLTADDAQSEMQTILTSFIAYSGSRASKT